MYPAARLRADQKDRALMGVVDVFLDGEIKSGAWSATLTEAEQQPKQQRRCTVGIASASSPISRCSVQIHDLRAA
jgi:hypothetical protein